MIDLEDDLPPAPTPAPPRAAPAPKVKAAAPKKPHGMLYPAEEAKAPGRVPPHSVEAEEQLLSACLLDGGDVMQRCHDSGIHGGMGIDSAFYVPANRLIYDRLVVMWSAGKPIDLAVLAEELKTTRQLDEIGGYAYLTRISGRIPTTAGAGYFIDKVIELQQLRNFIRVSTQSVEDCYGYSGNREEFLRLQESRLTEFFARARNEVTHAPRSVFDFTYPEDDDPNSLIGADDWLGRGGGLLFVSHAGAGKSSLILDACLDWTRGLPFMNIASRGKHKILVVQSEDSDRYLGKIVTSYRAANKLGEAECKEIGQRFQVVQVKGVSGMAFLTALHALVRKHQPDIVVINPVYLYIDGDVSDSKETKVFLNGLDAINAKMGNSVGWILVHHTGKPPREEQKETMDWETAYSGIGSSVWANWPRCSMLLEPRAGNEGRYWLRLGKAGKNAGVKREYKVGDETVMESVTKLPVRHSPRMLEIAGRARPMIYWEADSEDGAEPPAAEKRRGPKSAWELEDVVKYFPSSDEPGIKIGMIARTAREACGVPESTFWKKRKELLSAGWITEVNGLTRRTAIGDDYARV